jgi:hypothetical protein
MLVIFQPPPVFTGSWLCSLFAVRAAPLKVNEPRVNRRGFELGVRYIAKPTIAEALFSDRRAA